MSEEKSPAELTTTLHLIVRDASDSTDNQIAQSVAELSDEDREVIAQIAQSGVENALLFITHGSASGSRFLITAEGATIGRGDDSDVFLDDVTVSRLHAKISKVGSNYVLKDQGSLNGTYVSDVSISEHTLLSGDEFQIGKFHLLFISTI